MFPLKRGLMHSLWAGNFWSFYCLLDFMIYSFGLIKKTYILNDFSKKEKEF